MDIKIYQIDMDADINSVKFLSYDRMEKYQGFKGIDSSIYELAYEGNVDCSNLEGVYQKFNIDHPSDFRGHSLSVSDVVEICKSDTVKPGFYFCDSVGFIEVEFQPEKCRLTERKDDTVDKISVLLVKANKYPEMVEIENTLEAKQALVGGDIEMYRPYDDETCIICNEYGKITGMPLNRAVYSNPEEKEGIIEIMAGDFFICSAPYTSSDFESLSPEMAEKYKNIFMYPEVFFRSAKEIIALPYEPEGPNLDDMVKKAGETAKNQADSKNKESKSREDFTK